MRLSTPKIYLSLLVLLAVILTAVVVFNKYGTKQTPVISGDTGMPNDDIHKGLKEAGTASPGKGNVSETVKRELEELKQLVEKNPNDTSKMRAYAEMLAQSHKLNEAFEIFEKILKIDPKRTDLLFSMSYFYNLQGELKKALETTNRILSIDKKNPQARYNQGVIYAEMGRPEDARKLWSVLVKENPNSEIGKLAAESLKKL